MSARPTNGPTSQGAFLLGIANPFLSEKWIRPCQRNRASFSLLEHLPQRLQAAFQETCRGGRGAIEPFSDLGQLPPVPVLEDQGLALGFGQSGQGAGETNGPLLALGLL